MSKSLLENLSFVLLAALLCAAGLFEPLPQSQAYHLFADTRPWGALPNAADVLSNLAFVLAGLVGLRVAPKSEVGLQGPLNLFSMGLLLTGVGSALYHFAPNDASLVWDRFPLTLAFAGAMGAMAYDYLGPSYTHRWKNTWLYLGPFSVALWAVADDLRLYLVVQGGGFLLGLLWMTAARWSPTRAKTSLPWHWVWAGYALAKLAELADPDILAATGGLVSGHSLKHLLAAMSVLPLWLCLSRRAVEEPKSSKWTGTRQEH